MQNMGKVGKIEPYSSVWIPNFIVLGGIIYTSYKMQKDLPFQFTGWAIDHTITTYEFFKNIFSKLLPVSDRNRITPLKYGPNRQAINESTRKIMREKVQKLK